MLNIHSIKDAQDFRNQSAKNGARVSVVPTMGALHEGHLSLIDLARSQSDVTIATIFVNPLQFAPGEDFDEYPRQNEADAALLKARGCDAVFMPPHTALFAPDFSTTVSVAGVGDDHCALARPHFFDGVATIVTKLLLILRPDLAVFGEKDFQQLAVIRRLVRDLHIGVDIVGGPIVREPDGLAMSSRNQYLSATERAIAPALNASLIRAARAAAKGKDWAAIEAAAIREITEAGFTSVDYVHLVNASDLTRIERTDGPARILAAARLNDTRLIDNVPV